MTITEIYALLEQTGYPVAYHSFQGKVPPMPYLCYFVPYSRNFLADGKVYARFFHLQVELYTKYKDFEAEEKVEAALSRFCWSKDENYLKEESCYQIIYEWEV